MANVLLWHAGLTLVPDTDTSTWDGVTDCGDAVYQLEVAGKTMKFAVGVNENIPPITTKLNFRPGVMHFVYIKTDTTPGDCGIATDQPGLDGKKESLASSPSPSWVRPSGIPPDGAARTVHMKTIAKSSRGKSKSDKDYLKARRKLPDNMLVTLLDLASRQPSPALLAQFSDVVPQAEYGLSYDRINALAALARLLAEAGRTDQAWNTLSAMLAKENPREVVRNSLAQALDAYVRKVTARQAKAKLDGLADPSIKALFNYVLYINAASEH